MFILDEKVKMVKNKKIIPLLQEVQSSYYQGNYRSALVVNYTAIVMDLLDKLTDLSLIHGDSVSEKILTEVEAERKKNPTSPKWESELIELIEQRTELLDNYDVTDLDYVKTQRNYAAHPVTTVNGGEWELKTITQETCLDVLRKSFDIVFLKQPILGKKILLDIVSFAKKATDSYGFKYENFSERLKERYLNRMSLDAKDYVFKEIFKFVFRIADNEDIIEGRISNTNLLNVMLDDDYDHYIKFLETLKIDQLDIGVEPVATNPHFSKTRSVALLRLIGKYPAIKNILHETTVRDLETSLDNMNGHKIKNEEPGYLREMFNWRASIILTTPEQFLDKLLLPISTQETYLHMINEGVFKFLYKQFLFYGKHEDFLSFAVHNLTTSGSYAYTDKDMEKIPYLYEKLSLDLFDQLLFRLNYNNQFYGNGHFANFFEDLVEFYNNKFGIDLPNDNKRILFENLYNDTKNINLSSDEIPNVLKILDKNATNISDNDVNNTYSRIANTQEILESDDGNYCNYNNLKEALVLIRE